MNAIIRRAHQIRKEAAVKFGGKPGQYSMEIACKMAKNGETVETVDYVLTGTPKQIKYATDLIAQAKVLAAPKTSKERRYAERTASAIDQIVKAFCDHKPVDRRGRAVQDYSSAGSLIKIFKGADRYRIYDIGENFSGWIADGLTPFQAAREVWRHSGI